MTNVPTRDEIAAYARHIGLNLPDAYIGELVSAYTNVRTLIATMPTDRPHGDEPAHIFSPRAFLPADPTQAKA